MRSGKKSIAEKIVYRALDAVLARLKKQQSKKDEAGDAGEGEKGGGRGSSTASRQKPVTNAIDVLDRALTHISPTVELKSRRVGGATYQIPIEVASDRGKALARRLVSAGC